MFDEDAELELATLISQLQADKEPLASEIEVLQSIFDPGSIRVWHPSDSQISLDSDIVRYQLETSLPAPHDDVRLRLLVSLPPGYPMSLPPQLQLLSRYIGPFGVDSDLFGSVTRTFISHLDGGVQFTPDVVCVFDGVQSVIDRCTQWYEAKLSETAIVKVLDERQEETDPSVHTTLPAAQKSTPVSALMPQGVQMFVAETITDRKSAFIGRACRISDPSQVPRILAYLMSDHRIAKAAHPIINAWRCRVGAVLHQDNDDDGETAAGGRLAHLLQILDVNNVLVIVTRYFGGIHLGPDRFKHINQAGRNALELGGFLDMEPQASGNSKKMAARSKR